MSERFVARPEVQCIGKIGYASPHAAHKARSRMKSRYQVASNVYRCPHCADWHIGRPPQTAYRRNIHR